VFEDYYNLRFVIVLEDVSPNQERGEPNGFTAEVRQIRIGFELEKKYFNRYMRANILIYSTARYCYAI
jgi:hypothetical protein